MASIFGSDSAYSRFMNKVGDIILLSILWLICSLPLFTLGTAMCAAYYTAAKVIRHNNGYVFKQFMKSFRQNLKQSAGMNLVFLLCAGVLVFNFMFFKGGTTETAFYLRCVYLVMGFILLGMMLYAYPVLSRFNLKTGKVFHMAFQLMFRHFGTTVLLAAACVLAVFGIYMMPWAVLILPGLLFFLMTFPMERVLKKYMPKPEEGTQEAECWYYQ